MRINPKYLLMMTFHDFQVPDNLFKIAHFLFIHNH